MDNVIIYDKLEELNEGIEYNWGGINTLLNNSLLNAESVVKSVQRGVSTFSFNSGHLYYEIPISAINTSKSILVANIETANLGAGSGGVFPGYVELESGKIKLNHQDGAGGYYTTVDVYFSWQVIEYY